MVDGSVRVSSIRIRVSTGLDGVGRCRDDCRLPTWSLTLTLKRGPNRNHKSILCVH